MAFAVFFVMIAVIDIIVYLIFKVAFKWILIVDGVILVVWAIVLLAQFENQKGPQKSNKAMLDIIDKAIEEEQDEDIDYYPG